LTSNPNRLTCSLLSNGAGRYAFIHYDEAAGTLTAKANIAQSSFPSALSGLSVSQMSQAILDESCSLMRYGNQVYTISQNGLTSTNFGSGILASSSDLQYLVSGTMLYKYSSSANSYAQFTTLTSYSSYFIKSSSNKIVVWGASAVPSGSKYTVDQTVYAILDNSGSANAFY